MENVLAGTMIIGFVNISNFAFEGNWKSFGKAMVALIAGVVFGYFKFYGLPSVEVGLGVALSSSGVFALVKMLKPVTGQPNL